MTPLFEKLVNIMRLNRNNFCLSDIDFENVSFYEDDEENYYVDDKHFSTYKSAWLYAFLLTILVRYNINFLTEEDKDFIIQIALSR